MLSVALRPISFNPRSRTGSDYTSDDLSVLADAFQSTLPHGERRHILKYLPHFHDVSIHAPARGATVDHRISFDN